MILIDARATRRMSVGMRAYVAELCARLPGAAPDLAYRTFEEGANFSLREQLALPLASRGAALVHYPTFFAPVWLPRRYVVTIHDCIHLRFPQLFGWATGAYHRLVVRRLVRGAARVLVGDRRTATDCERYFGVHPQRVRVVPLGYDPALLDAPAYRGGRAYLLYAGNHRAHKNLRTLIAAWRSLPKELELDLCLTGDDDLGMPLEGGPGRLLFLGNVSPQELAGRMRGALALVQPSLAEGYGLPVLEAMVRGTPVVASSESVPEALERYVAAFPALEVDALRYLLEEAARSPGRLRALAAEGEAVARAYTWDRFAASTASVYREALEGSAR